MRLPSPHWTATTAGRHTNGRRAGSDAAVGRGSSTRGWSTRPAGCCSASLAWRSTRWTWPSGHWIREPADRAVLLWARGTIVRGRLGDPKAALADLAATAAAACDWLSGPAAQDRDGCSAEADASRKRKPSVAAAPAYLGLGSAGDTVAGPTGEARVAGARPPVWEAVVRHLA